MTIARDAAEKICIQFNKMYELEQNECAYKEDLEIVEKIIAEAIEKAKEQPKEQPKAPEMSAALLLQNYTISAGKVPAIKEQSNDGK